MIKKLYVISKEIKNKIPRPHRNIDKHYVLEYNENNVCVFTRHPLPGYKSYLISNTTIENKNENQYLTGILYKIDSTNAILCEAPNAKDFSIKNMQKIADFKQEIPNFPVFEIAKHIYGIE